MAKALSVFYLDADTAPYPYSSHCNLSSMSCHSSFLKLQLLSPLLLQNFHWMPFSSKEGTTFHSGFWDLCNPAKPAFPILSTFTFPVLWPLDDPVSLIHTPPSSFPHVFLHLECPFSLITCQCIFKIHFDFSMKTWFSFFPVISPHSTLFTPITRLHIPPLIDKWTGTYKLHLTDLGFLYRAFVLSI